MSAGALPGNRWRNEGDNTCSEEKRNGSTEISRSFSCGRGRVCGTG
jgi:hypothetical protein